MNCKNLSKYLKFDADKFFDGVKLELIAKKYDESSQTTKFTGVIIEDDKDENLYAKINFKFAEKGNLIDMLELRSIFVPKNIVKTSIWGEYRDCLSVEVIDIEVVR